VIRSRAELAALLMKAVRGAGLPLALAEDLYLMADFISADDVTALAEDIAQGGTALLELTNDLDQVAGGAMELGNHPLGPAMAAARGWSLKGGRKTKDRPEKQTGPLDVPDATLAVLEGFAARTYVPETATSRARGAGAGAIDND